MIRSFFYHTLERLRYEILEESYAGKVTKHYTVANFGECNIKDRKEKLKSLQEIEQVSGKSIFALDLKEANELKETGVPLTALEYICLNHRDHN